ncbi:patatin [Scytonema sp. UIC 10036]|uniref:patatin-like phospholipase family protein n=1 Tax=Scytonema sp. UIC 10036 TaxID=2304196 RepID=UPI0012DA4412|nr:patatin-like phospholipase family protein [Scytonema sp. UIC 10036]MUG93722.1 patatin [Scytonema sp. UIC 10036]
MTFKILSLDGGGIRGVLSATILKEIERILSEKKGQKLHEYFDLIAGTSTGSILAAGIACQKKADDLIKLYIDEGKNIFLDDIRWQRKWRWWTQAIGSDVLYPHERGEQGLARVLKRNLIHQKLGKSPTIAEIKQPNLLILAYDVLSRNTTWFANDDPEEWYYKNNIELWKICTASASAPTFFPPYELPYNSHQSLPHIDGGVSANNPELAAIAHALSMQRSDQCKTKIDEIAVLSIGTGRTTRPYTYCEIKNWGLLNWVTNIPHIFLDPSAENSAYITKRMFLNWGCQNYLRLNFELNEKFEETRETGRLRTLLKQTYNKYIFTKDGDKIYLEEDIDDPTICEDLKAAAQGYIKTGKVSYQGKNAPVRTAIQQFIESH